jgi:hypothetical protein
VTTTEFRERPRVEELPDLWRKKAKELRPYTQSAATAFERAATELEQALNSYHHETLSLTEAARESGYSVEYLGRLVRHGMIPNPGKKGSPRIRRCDLPRKPGGAAADAKPRTEGDSVQVESRSRSP